PFVIWGVSPGNHGFSSVSGDSFAGGKIATERLIAIGRERIAFLGGPAKEQEVQDRYRGYEAALREAGAAVAPALVGHGDYSPASGAETMRELLRRVPDLDAVFVNSDLMAIAAMDAIREQGGRV